MESRKVARVQLLLPNLPSNGADLRKNVLPKELQVAVCLPGRRPNGASPESSPGFVHHGRVAESNGTEQRTAWTLPVLVPEKTKVCDYLSQAEHHLWCG